jgi:hypothetical protein
MERVRRRRVVALARRSATSLIRANFRAKLLAEYIKIRQKRKPRAFSDAL